MSVEAAGRTDLDELFRLSGVLDQTLTHTPFLAFREDGEGVRVIIVDRATDLLVYPPETRVMVQWAGKWRSDFFQMTVGDVLRALTKRAERSRQVNEAPS